MMKQGVAKLMRNSERLSPRRFYFINKYRLGLRIIESRNTCEIIVKVHKFDIEPTRVCELHRINGRLLYTGLAKQIASSAGSSLIVGRDFHFDYHRILWINMRIR